MASGPRYRLPFRRRLEARTNYRKRRALILSGKPRLVIRPSSKHLVAQLVTAEPAGDKTIASAHTKQLPEDWKIPRGNAPSAYLTGLLLGKRAVSKSIKEAVLDVGVRRISRGSRVMAALKGVLDAGVQVPHNPEILPDEKRISGVHVAEHAAKVKSEPEQYKALFSRYLANGIRPEQVPALFEQVKSKISGEVTT